MTRANGRAPAGLGTAGRALFRRVSHDYELRHDEMVPLEMACKSADTFDRLAAEMGGQPLVVVGVNGQDRVNPLIVEIRQQPRPGRPAEAYGPA